MIDPFVTPQWLAERLGDAAVVPVDASFYLPDESKDAGVLFEAGHIPGAVRFDIDAIADQTGELPHTLPDEATFASKVGDLGIGNATIVVVYDTTDLLGGARAWWMLRHYGANDVRLLQGGFAAWKAEGHPTAIGRASRSPAPFKARFDPAAVATAVEVLAAVQNGTAQIVDARSAPRFEGSVAEPRPGLRSGHMPGARNVPWRTIIDGTGRLRPTAEIAAAFTKAGVDLAAPLIASCGSGVSAAVLILGLEAIGKRDTLLYDGSWAEWGGRHDLPIATGRAS